MQKQNKGRSALYWLWLAVLGMSLLIFLIYLFKNSFGGEVFAALIFLVIIAACVGVYAIKKPIHQAKIGYLSAGEVTVFGMVRIDQTIQSPYGGRDCAYYQATKYVRTKNDGVKAVECYQAGAESFYIEDDTGRIALDVPNTAFYFEPKAQIKIESGHENAYYVEDLLQEHESVVVEGVYQLEASGRRVITKFHSGGHANLYTALQYQLSKEMSKIGKTIVYLTVMTLFLMAFLLLSTVTETKKGISLELFLVGSLDFVDGALLMGLQETVQKIGFSLSSYIALGLIYLFVFSIGSYLLMLLALATGSANIFRWFIEIIALTMMSSLVPMVILFFLFGIFALDPYKAWLALFFSYPVMALYILMNIPRLSRENERYLAYHHQNERLKRQR